MSKLIDYSLLACAGWNIGGNNGILGGLEYPPGKREVQGPSPENLFYKFALKQDSLSHLGIILKIGLQSLVT